MSIFDKESQSRPGGVRLFTNRFERSRDFAARLNDDPPRQTISFYVGVGGNGKTALLRSFQSRCCYRLPADQWEEVRSYPDEFFVDSLSQAPGAELVPTTFLDFGAQPSGANHPREAFTALFMLKRQLAKFQIETPRFDFAAIAYLHKSGGDVKAAINELFPPSELAAAGSIADAFLNLPVFQVSVALFETVRGRLDNLLSQRRIKRGVPREVVDTVVSLVPEPDLIEALPRFFAEDLRETLAAKKRPSRIVLLFDTYEAFAGEIGPAGRRRIADHGGPRWFRSLLGNLPLADGVVVVVAGRTDPQWSDAAIDAIPNDYVETTALGALPERFADLYLTEAGVADPALRAALVGYATVEPGLVHPLLLGLCADVVLTAAERGRPFEAADFPAATALHSKERELAARLLSRVSADVEDAIVAVAAARSFDYDVVVYLGTKLDFPVSSADFRRIIAFSFVTPHQRPSGVGPALGRSTARFAVHNLLRRALARVAPEDTSRAHEVLIDYYRSVPGDDEFTARLEQIYHRARLNPVDGVAQWRDEMSTALATSRFDRCRSLITLLADLEMPSQADAEACTYQVARAEIALGRWGQAAGLLESLPAGAPYALLLRADLAFVQGEFTKAEQYSAEALASVGPGPERLPFLYRSAELRLFLGEFSDGRRLCEEGLELVGGDGDANEAARWHDLLAEVEFFSGHVDDAKTQLRHAQERLDTIPEETWDRVVEASIRVDEAVVAEAEDRPLDARRGQTEALRIRREIADARGAAHALNGLGLAAVQLGDPVEAEARFAEAATAARDLGEDLLYAKVARGQAEAAILAGRLDDADRLAAEALRRFERCGIPYDVTHAWITQAQVQKARGDDGSWLALVDRARREIERNGYGSLYVRCPEIRPAEARRVAGAMLAFAAGDALGVPWEGDPPEAIDADRIAELPAREGWPRGATSDDTAQMMLVAECLVESGGRPTAEDFLARLAVAGPTMRGVGPTTRAALEHYRATGRPPEPSADGRQGSTNGAAMRMLPVGWSVPVADPDLRRDIAVTLARATHPAAEAVGAACVVTAMATWAVETVGMKAILAAATAEVDWISARYPEVAAAFGVVADAASGRWQPPPGGVTLDAAQTVAAVVHVLAATDDPASALPYAVSLGGDTDTVAALVGGILGGRDPAGVSRLEWLHLVAFEERYRIDDLAAGIGSLRGDWYGR